MGITKRPLVPVLLAIRSEKLTNVPRLFMMVICINSYQQLTPETLVLRTGSISHCISGPYCMYGKQETASRPCTASNKEWETNQRATATQDGFIINAYQQLVSQTSLLLTGPNAHSINYAGPYCMYWKHETASRLCIASDSEWEINQRAMATQDWYMLQLVSAVNPSNISPTHRTHCTLHIRPILYVWEARNGLSPLYCQQ